MNNNLGNFKLILPKDLFIYIILEHKLEIMTLLPQNYDLNKLTFYDLYLLFSNFSFFNNLLNGFLLNQLFFYHHYIHNLTYNDSEIKYLLNLKKDFHKYKILIYELMKNYNNKLNELNNILQSNNKKFLKDYIINKINLSDFKNEKLLKLQLLKSQNFNKNNLNFVENITNLINSNPQNNELFIINNIVKTWKENYKMKINGSLIYIYSNQLSIYNYSTNNKIYEYNSIIFEQLIDIKKIKRKINLNNFKKMITKRNNIILNYIKKDKKNKLLFDHGIDFGLYNIHKNLIIYYQNNNDWKINNSFENIVFELAINKKTVVNWWKSQNKINQFKLKNNIFIEEIEKCEKMMNENDLNSN